MKYDLMQINQFGIWIIINCLLVRHGHTIYVYMDIHIECPLALLTHVQNCVLHADCRQNRLLKLTTEQDSNNIRYIC